MALINTIDPKGIDVVINSLQRDLFIELTKKFGWKNYDSYGRVYRNRNQGDIIPEAYKGKEEYKEVLFNDKLTVTSFFLSDEKRKYNSKEFTYQQGVSIIFQADLSKLFPSIKHRPDEELINNIVRAINNKFWINRLTEIITGVDKVYESLKLNIEEEHYMNDMGSFCMARFNFDMIYTNTSCGTQALK